MPEIPAFARLGAARTEFAGAIFDFDGTLADSMWVWNDIDRRFCEEYHLALPDDYTDSIVGLGFEGTAKYFIEELGLKMSVDQCCNEFNRIAKKSYCTRVLLRPGARTFLKELKGSGIPVAIASSLVMDLLQPALERNDAFDLIDAFRLCDNYNTHKSETLIYELAAEAIGVPVEECVIFEDILPAVRSIKRAGAFAVAVIDESNEAQNTEVIQKEADLCIADFTELLA